MREFGASNILPLLETHTLGCKMNNEQRYLNSVNFSREVRVSFRFRIVLSEGHFGLIFRFQTELEKERRGEEATMEEARMRKGRRSRALGVNLLVDLRLGLPLDLLLIEPLSVSGPQK